MDWAWMVVAAAAGGAFGWLLPPRQHVLYRNEAYRAEPATGKRLFWLRMFSIPAAAVGLALAARPDHYEAGPAIASMAFLLVLVGISSTDFDRRIIPNKIIYPAIVAAVTLCWIWPDRDLTDIAIGGAVALGVAVFMVVLGLLIGGMAGTSETAFGMGDAKLILFMGLLLGWPALLNALFFGILLAGGVSVYFLLRKGKRSTFSYGPYLAAGAATLLLFPNLA